LSWRYGLGVHLFQGKVQWSAPVNFVVTFQGICNLANFLTNWDRWRGVGQDNQCRVEMFKGEMRVEINRTRLLRRSLKLNLKGKRPMGWQRMWWFNQVQEDIKKRWNRWQDTEKETLWQDREEWRLCPPTSCCCCFCCFLSTLCRVFTIIHLKQTIYLGYIVLQLFCNYSLCYFPCSMLCTFTFWSMCAVPNMAVFCSSLTSCFSGMLLRYCLNDFEMVSAALVSTGITYVCTFQICFVFAVSPYIS